MAELPKYSGAGGGVVSWLVVLHTELSLLNDSFVLLLLLLFIFYIFMKIFMKIAHL
jgi:hypothetical protein